MYRDVFVRSFHVKGEAIVRLLFLSHVAQHESEVGSPWGLLLITNVNIRVDLDSVSPVKKQPPRDLILRRSALDQSSKRGDRELVPIKTLRLRERECERLLLLYLVLLLLPMVLLLF